MTPLAPRDRCKHGVMAVGCALCSPVPRSPPPRQPRHTHEASTGGGDPRHRRVQSPPLPLNFAILHTNNRASCEKAAARFGPEVTVVHLDGFPFLWAVELVLARAPNLQVLQLTPRQVDQVHEDSHVALCKARGVRIQAGYARHDLDLPDRGPTPQFHVQRRFLKGLGGEQLADWTELLTMGFEAALVTARYFCLSGEDYVPMRAVAIEFGCPKPRASFTSNRTNACLRYLDPTFPAGGEATRRARAMRDQVTRLKPLLASAAARAEEARKIHLPYLPRRLPFADLDLYKRVLSLYRVGAFDKIRRRDERRARMIELRFGLDRLDAPEARTLQEVANHFGVSREWVRLEVNNGLRSIGIRVDE